MIAQNFDYSSPNTIEEALALLAGGSAKALAGGQSLIPLMKLRLAGPEHLVDLGRVQGLNYIREQDGEVHIGATTTHFQVESSPLLRARCPLLPEAAGRIGDVQVRNLGTIGGSLAHADPAADYPASLLALEVKLRLVSAGSERVLGIEEFLVDTFTTALEPGELIAAVIAPVESEGTGTTYQKVVQAASGFAIVGIAARIRKQAGVIAMARIGVTGLAPLAFRAREAERLLEGTPGSLEDIRKAAGVVAEGVEANSDLHASADYRRHLARVHAARALTVAISKAG